MSVSKVFFVALIFSFSVTSLAVSRVFGDNDETLATLAIYRAESDVASAYDAVLEAEQVGANVSGLLARLSVAGEYLANAHMWHRLEAFENATRFADLCSSIVREMKSEAVELRNAAYELWVSNLVVKITGSLIGVVIIVLSSFIGWFVFRQRYHKQVLEMRPEAVSGES